MSYPKLKTERRKREEGEMCGIDAGEERESPTREQICELIRTSAVLCRPGIRRELRQIIQTFINKHSSET